MEVTILMPALDEAETIEICVRKAKKFLKEHAVQGEVLVSDNGSTDETREIARRNGARVVDATTKGYGAALIEGIKSARGRFIIMGDADDSYDFSDLMPFVSELRKGAELVMGNRFRGGIAKNAMPPLHRYLGNPVLSMIGRVFFRTPAKDFHCGLRGFSREAIISLNLNSTGMEFASEMVLKASIFGLKVVEVPTVLNPDGRSRPPHLRSWRDGWRHLKLLLSFAPRWLFFYPGLALFLIGFALFLTLMTGAVEIAGVRFDIAALILAVALVVTGSQALLFYALAQLFAFKYRGLPASPRFERFRRHVSVNKASAIGAALLVLGILSAVFSVLFWFGHGLGDLDPALISRPVSFSVVTASLGAQIFTAGFLWGIIEGDL